MKTKGSWPRVRREMKFTYLSAISILSISSYEVKFIRGDQCWKQLAVNKYLFSIGVAQVQACSTEAWINKKTHQETEPGSLSVVHQGLLWRLMWSCSQTLARKSANPRFSVPLTCCLLHFVCVAEMAKYQPVERLPSGRNGGLGILIYSLGMLLLCWIHRTKSNLRLAWIIIPSSFYNKTSFHGLAWRKYPKPDCRSSRGLWLKSLLLR